MPIGVKDSFKILGGEGPNDPFVYPEKNREQMSQKQLVEEKFTYQEEPLYFQKRADYGKLPKEEPGQKFNRAQVDSLIYARNLGVTMGLFTPEDGDMFIATQFREGRNDFGVNPEPKSINQGKTREAAARLFGVGPDLDNKSKTVQGLEFIPANRVKMKGAEVFPHVKRTEVEKMYSPYTSEKMTPENYESNAKLALLVYLSKKDKGESSAKVAKDWNGKGINKDIGANANTHLKEVMKTKEDLLHPNNAALRDYISQRLSDDKSIYRIPKKK
jgi:hypothetical protein